MFFPPQPRLRCGCELHATRLMVRSVSWLTLRPLFATAATSRRAKAQMRRELNEMADRFDDALEEVRAELRGVQGEFARLRAIDSAVETARPRQMAETESLEAGRAPGIRGLMRCPRLGRWPSLCCRIVNPGRRRLIEGVLQTGAIVPSVRHRAAAVSPAYPSRGES